MNDMTGTSTTADPRDPAAIEADIRQTQDEMSRTVDRIGDQLTPRNLLNTLFDKAENNDIDARMLFDQAKRNPIALAMIAGGAIWLISDSDAKLPSKIPSVGFGKSRQGISDHADPHHRDYVSHMQSVEWGDDEDPIAYQRRRDVARANYLMVERRHDEDDHGFRQRLDDAAEKFREKRHAWAESGSRALSSAEEGIGRAGSAVGDRARTAATGAQDAFERNPLVGGIAAAAVGALFGALLPITRTEQEKLAGVGEMARETVSEQKERLTEVAREKKDELVAKVEERAQGGGSQPGNQDEGGTLTALPPEQLSV